MLARRDFLRTVGVSAAALYWFVTVALYGAVWYTITITK